jgi:YndJ-like protein
MHTLKRWSHISAIVGGMAWLALLSVLPPDDPTIGLIARLLLLAILVFTPLALTFAGPHNRTGLLLQLYRAVIYLQPFAAALAAYAFLLPAGAGAGLLAASWLLFSGLVALFGLARFLARRSLRADELCIDAGLLFLPVGGIWLIMARLGVDPLGFGETIVLLTAVHFHYAGFAVPILAGMAGHTLLERSPRIRRAFWVVTAGVILGVPLVALGITFSRALEIAAALLLTTSLVMLALLIIFVVVPGVRQRAAQALLVISAATSVVTMLLAALYAAGGAIGFRITIPQMVVVHGLLNAFGLVLCGLLAWTIAALKGEQQ